MGVEKKATSSTGDKRLTAYHGSRSRDLFHVLPAQDPVHHVTIIPRSSGAGSFTMPLPGEDQAYRTKVYGGVHHRLPGRRAARQLTMEDISTGAYGDIKQAAQMARAMVTNYGMTDVSAIDYGSDDGEVFLGRDLAVSKGYSEVKAGDRRRFTALSSSISRLWLLSEHMDEMKRVAEYLIRNETLDGEETFVKVYNGEIVPDKDRRRGSDDRAAAEES